MTFRSTNWERLLWGVPKHHLMPYTEATLSSIANPLHSYSFNPSLCPNSQHRGATLLLATTSQYLTPPPPKKKTFTHVMASLRSPHHTREGGRRKEASLTSLCRMKATAYKSINGLPSLLYAQKISEIQACTRRKSSTSLAC